MVSARTITGSAETYLVRIKTLAREQGARCLVIDPCRRYRNRVTSKPPTRSGTSHRLVEGEGITLVCTSLLDEMATQQEAARRCRSRRSPTPGST
jgi:circadian clock protein KaiC